METSVQQIVAEVVLSVLRATAERRIVWAPTCDPNMIDACRKEINSEDSLRSDIFVTRIGSKYLRVFGYYVTDQSRRDSYKAIARDGCVYQLDVYDPQSLASFNSFNSSSALYDLYNCIINYDSSLNTLLEELRK